MVSYFYLTIGPVHFVLQSASDWPIRYDGWAYCGFFSERTVSASGGQVELRVQLVRADVNIPDGPPLYESGKNWMVWETSDGWFFCSGFAGRRRPLYGCRLNRDLSRAELLVSAEAEERYANPLRYPLDQILCWPLMARCGGVIMHAAAAVYEGRGFLFTGRSGAGKSTLSALCRDAGWKILNDDRAAVYLREGSVHLAGTPWHGSGCFAEAAEAPLAGIFLLTQSSTNRIERLSSAEARLAILDSVSIPWFEEEWAQQSLDALNGIIQKTPVYRFFFTKTPSAVQTMLSGPALTKGAVA